MKCLYLDFYLRRLHSLLGVMPLFVFVPIHVIQKAVPFFTFAFKDTEWITLILTGIAPFIMHGLIGIYIYIQNKSSVLKKTAGFLFRLQIISSFAILAFVPLHIYLFRVLRYNGSYFSFITAVIVFMLGIAAFAFHIGYGVYTFCITWGLCTTSRTRKRVRTIAAALGLIFGVCGVVLYAFVFASIKGMLQL